MNEHFQDACKIGCGTLLGYLIYRYFRYCKRYATYEKILHGIPEATAFERFGKWIKPPSMENINKYGVEEFIQLSTAGTENTKGPNDMVGVSQFRIAPFIAGPYVMITNRKAIERILKTPGNINRLDMNVDQFIFEKTMISSNGEDWKHRRRIMAKSFHMDMLASYHDGINRQCVKMIECLTEKVGSQSCADLSFRPVALAAAFDIAGDILFGQSFDIQRTLHETGEYPTWAKHVNNFLSTIGVALCQSLFGEFFFKTVQRKVYNLMNKSRVEFKEHMNILAQRRRQQVEDDPALLTANGSKLTIIDQILKLNADQQLSDEDMLSELLLFFVGGSDTTQNSLADGLCHLTQPRNKSIMAKLRDEIDAKFPDVSDMFVSNRDTDEMPYLDAVVREILRVAAPFALTGRLLEQPVRLSEDFTMNASKEFPVFTIMSLLSINNDTDLWGEDIAEFRPERHLDSAKPLPIPAFSYGARNCIGKHMALSTLKLELVYLFKYFEIECLEEVRGRAIEAQRTSVARKFHEEPKLRFTLRDTS